MSLLQTCQMCGDLGLLAPAPGGAMTCKVCNGIAHLAAVVNEAGLDDDQVIKAVGLAAASIQAQHGPAKMLPFMAR